MTIWELVEEALADLGMPVAANAMIQETGEQLPDQYLVYFLVSSPPELHADDVEVMRSYRIQVSVYSRSGLADLPDVDGAMTVVGFSRGPQRELPYNILTRHYGLALEYVYTEIPVEEISS
ncbi:MAG: hypothetical protein A2W35_05360 [Chloroflexi bacterium RBG_16_57_11]|nr:MAG: hypothetical protein A2W35_05360 [Chloroflexi bacterium RBG_16_57_11]